MLQLTIDLMNWMAVSTLLGVGLMFVGASVNGTRTSGSGSDALQIVGLCVLFAGFVAALVWFGVLVRKRKRQLAQEEAQAEMAFR